MLNKISKVFLILIATIISNWVYAQDVNSDNLNVNKGGVMLEGYDAVSYFMGSVTKGKSSIIANYKGVEFWFVSKENQEIFLRNPIKFIPAYGGWCAFAMGDSGEKVKIDPKTYKIVDGKLYLFYNFYFNNTLIDWNEDETNLMSEADKNWLKLNQK